MVMVDTKVVVVVEAMVEIRVLEVEAMVAIKAQEEVAMAAIKAQGAMVATKVEVMVEVKVGVAVVGVAMEEAKVEAMVETKVVEVVDMEEVMEVTKVIEVAMVEVTAVKVDLEAPVDMVEDMAISKVEDKVGAHKVDKEDINSKDNMGHNPVPTVDHHQVDMVIKVHKGNRTARVALQVMGKEVHTHQLHKHQQQAMEGHPITNLVAMTNKVVPPATHHTRNNLQHQADMVPLHIRQQVMEVQVDSQVIITEMKFTNLLFIGWLCQ